MDSSANQSNEVIQQEETGSLHELSELSSLAEPSGENGDFLPAGSPNSETPVTGDSGEEEEEKTERKIIPEDFYYVYEELHSKPFITPDSDIPANLLYLLHSFGYDCSRRANLQLLDECTLSFIAGNVLILLDLRSKEQRYLRSCSGGGIGSIMVHPRKTHFAVAEKGTQPSIIIYEYPSLRPYRILRGGTDQAYSFVDFDGEGALLASVGSAPDYMLTVWDWQQERVMLRSKAFSQDVYRVTFSPDNPGQLTSSGSGHIKFWKMASTFTGLKLQGLLGRFGKTPLTDIEGYIELPDGKVVSGSEWGNMLVWDGGLIKVEICRKGGRPCHNGSIQQFALDEGELMTIGTDGAVRGWNFESIDTADCSDDSGLFEMEPMNEMTLGRNVRLSSMVKSSAPDSSIWFAQDSNGAIWKLDLSFSNQTSGVVPECLFSFHAGAILGMDVSSTAHLMATTALDRSVRVFDFLAKKELTFSRYKQGGTTLTWAPPIVNPRGGLLAVGYDDGVVRLLELLDPQNLRTVANQSRDGNVEIRLIQAFKPHNAPVTAIAFECNGEIMATGSTDASVFFFRVGDKYAPIGFVNVPGPVQGLEWSPQSHERNALLILCRSGHVVEIQAPDPEGQTTGSSYEIRGLPVRHFRFHSIKSRIKRDVEVTRRKKEVEEQVECKREEGLEEEEEEEEEELPPLFSPVPPSPLLCGFYSRPGAFWLSMGGYDSGFLYHCQFSDKQEEDPLFRQDEPFAFLPVQDTEQDPILSVSFSSNRQLFLCGMQSGRIRAYPLQSGDLNLTSIQAFWALSVHDNQHGAVRQLRCSYDEQFVLTAGQDGNIFVFSLLPQEELLRALEQGGTRVPSPHVGTEMEKEAQDIEDPNAYSIETAKQRTELERMLREAEQRKVERRRKLAELQSEFKQLLQRNRSLPENLRLHPTELELDRRFREETERLSALQVREVRRELAWEEERHRIGLRKLQERFWGSLESDTVTVVAFQSEHKISSYRLMALSPKVQQIEQCGHLWPQGGQERRRSRADPGKESAPVTVVHADLPGENTLQPLVGRSAGSKLSGRQAEKLRKATEKAEQARLKIETRRRDWLELLAAKPLENCEDPQDVLAIQQAAENMGDFKLKTAKDFTVPEQLRMNPEKKRAQLVALEEKLYEKKAEMNVRILALREAKVQAVSQLRALALQLQHVQEHLRPERRQATPVVPTLRPEETPERKLRYTRTTLLRFGGLRDTEGQPEEKGDPTEVTDPTLPSHQIPHTPEGTQLTELEVEMRQVEELRHLYLQETLLEQMAQTVWRFDAELRLLRHDKQCLDTQMKQADLHHVTMFQELLLLREFEKEENTLQERLNLHQEENRNVRSKVEECKQLLEVKQREISSLQDREKALTSTFQAMIGDNSTFARFLTTVFKKKIKGVKRPERPGEYEEEEGSDEGSNEGSDWEEDDDGDFDEDDDGSGSGGPLDDSVCPPNCDPLLFENTTELRKRRLELEEQLAEERKNADSLRKECDSLLKKERTVQCSLQAAERDLKLFNRDKQQKLNELDVIVPLRLHQIELVSNGPGPGKMSKALVLNTAALAGLRERIRELQVERNQQRDLFRWAQHQHVQLIQDQGVMEAKIKELEARCEQLMMRKFGKLVDLEALQTFSGNRKLEEMRQDCRVREADYIQENKHWEDKLREVKQVLMEVTRKHTERIHCLNRVLTEKKELEDQLNARQTKMGAQFQERCPEERRERRSLHRLVKTQELELETLRQEIDILSHKGGHILPPTQPPPTPLPPVTQECRHLRLGHPSLPTSTQGLG